MRPWVGPASDERVPARGPDASPDGAATEPGSGDRTGSADPARATAWAGAVVGNGGGGPSGLRGAAPVLDPDAPLTAAPTAAPGATPFALAGAVPAVLAPLVGAARSPGANGSRSFIPLTVSSTWMNSSPSIPGSPIRRTRPTDPDGNCALCAIATRTILP